MILPLATVLVVALLVLGAVLAMRYPLSTWKAQAQRVREIAADTSEPARVVHQSVHLEDLMTRAESSTYVGTDSFPRLVSVVEKAMDSAESGAARLRRSPVREAQAA